MSDCCPNVYDCRNQSQELKLIQKNMTTAKSTTLSVIKKYLIRDKEGNVDALGILSRNSYKEWLKTRKYVPKDPPHAFRKLITGHCRGDKGLAPFEKDTEASVLKLLRRKKVWECFEGSSTKIGLRGFQTLGYWESRRKEAVNFGKRKFMDKKQNKQLKRKKSQSCAEIAVEAMNQMKRSRSFYSIPTDQQSQSSSMSSSAAFRLMEEMHPQFSLNYQNIVPIQQFGSYNNTKTDSRTN